MKPTGNKILVKRNEKLDNVTSSGIYLGKERENFVFSTVIEIGTKTDSNEINVGNIVMHSSQHGLKIDYNDEEHLILAEEAVIGVIT